jgi:hypothetical protein
MVDIAGWVNMNPLKPKANMEDPSGARLRKNKSLPELLNE